MTRLVIENLSFSYGKKIALRDISFQIEEGKFCALLGPNGAEKYTLFGLLTRLFTSKVGTISIAGFDIKNSPRNALANIGVVFQQSTLDLDLSIINNLKYATALHGLTGTKANYSIDQSLERMGLKLRKKNVFANSMEDIVVAPKLLAR